MSQLLRHRRLLLSSTKLLSTKRVTAPLAVSVRLFSQQPSAKPAASTPQATAAAVSKEGGEKKVSMLKSIVDGTVDAVRNPRQTWASIKEVLHHYWLGSKLLWSEMKLTTKILKRVVGGHAITRRERMQLIRTTNDMFRLVPFAVFVIVPFMEFLLPFALKIFPNMLPSTFTDSLKKEENMKKELQMRLALAGFLQDTFKEMIANQKKGGDEAGAQEVITFIEKTRQGQQLPNDSVIRIAQLFKDELTLDNIARPQLVSMCQYMGLHPYGNDALLRFQIRNRVKNIKEDDRRILWEGVESLTVEELQDACRERGMRSVGLTHFGYRKQLQDWLDLSTRKNIPISLLIMSRAFNLTSTKIFEPENVLRSSLGSLTDDTINEVVLAAATKTEENSVELKMRRLESLQYQTELISDEASSHAADVSADVPVVDKAASIGAAASGEKVTEMEPVSQAPELTIHDMETIGDLARGSSVVREKAELSKLEATIDSVQLPLDSASSGSTAKFLYDLASRNRDEVEVQHLHAVLNSMVEKLKKDIDTTEKALSDKIVILDQDGDGELSAEELQDAIAKILKRVTSEQEAEAIVKILDKDMDGRVSVVELLQFVESLKIKAEVRNMSGAKALAQDGAKLEHK